MLPRAVPVLAFSREAGEPLHHCQASWYLHDEVSVTSQDDDLPFQSRSWRPIILDQAMMFPATETRLYRVGSHTITHRFLRLHEEDSQDE